MAHKAKDVPAAYAEYC
jgi:hypothetical protein